MSYLMFVLLMSMLPLTVVVHHKLCCVQQRRRRNVSIWRLAWPAMPALHLYVFQLMACLGLRLIFFFVAWLSGYLLSGRDHTVKLLAGFDQDFRLQYFGPLCCVCGVRDQDGDLWALWMERLFLNLTDILL